MTDIVIQLKRRRHYFHLFIGFIWLIVAISSILVNETLHWIDCLYFIISLIYFAHFLYDQKHEYLIIKEGILKPNRLYGNKHNVLEKDIISIQKKWNEYIISTGKNEVKLNIELIEKKSLDKLQAFFKSLGLSEENLSI